MIELEDFIAESLRSVVAGIRAARKMDGMSELAAPLIQGHERNAVGIFYYKKGKNDADHHKQQATIVSFELALSAKEATKEELNAGIKAKLYVLASSLGGKLGSSTESANVHKMSFSVALGFPKPGN
jgi:hypothetical protein